jgi:hypothetical protein
MATSGREDLECRGYSMVAFFGIQIASVVVARLSAVT